MFKNVKKNKNKEYYIDPAEALNVYLLNVAASNERFVDFELFNNNQALLFRTEQLMPLDKLGKEMLNDQLFAVLFYQMCELNQILKQYDVNQDFVVWDEKMIFYNPDKNAFYFILLPILHSSLKKNFFDFNIFLSGRVVDNNAFSFIPLVSGGKWKRLNSLEEFAQSLESIVNYQAADYPPIADVSNDAYAVKPIHQNGAQAEPQNVQQEIQYDNSATQVQHNNQGKLNDLPKMYEATMLLDDEMFPSNEEGTPQVDFGATVNVNDMAQAEAGATEMFTDDMAAQPQVPVYTAPPVDDEPLGETQILIEDEPGEAYAPQATSQSFGETEIFVDNNVDFGATVNANDMPQAEVGATEMFTDDMAAQPQAPVYTAPPVDDEPLGETQILIEDEPNEAYAPQAAETYAPQAASQSFGETEIFVDNSVDFGATVNVNDMPQAEAGATEMFTDDMAAQPQAPVYTAPPVDDEPLGETQILIEDEPDEAYAPQAAQPYAPQAASQSFGETEIFVDNSVDFGATVNANDMAQEAGATVMFDSPMAPPPAQAAMPRAKLTNPADNAEVYITANPFKIGSANYMNMVLHSIHVSREHLTIFNENNIFYAVDNKSTNGSVLNGAVMQPFMRYPLNPGDSLYLADVPLVFNIE